MVIFRFMMLLMLEQEFDLFRPIARDGHWGACRFYDAGGWTAGE